MHNSHKVGPKKKETRFANCNPMRGVCVQIKMGTKKSANILMHFRFGNAKPYDKLISISRKQSNADAGMMSV